MPENMGIKRAILGVSGIVLISKLLGFLREMVIAEGFGTSREYDIFLIAIAAPIFFNLVIVRSANFLMVPFLSSRVSNSTSHSDWRDIWSVFNSVLAVVIILVILILIVAPFLVKLIGSDLDGENLSKAIFYCRAVSVLILLGFLESFLRSALNVKKQFIYPVLGTIILNISIITIIYLFSARLSVTAILIGLVIGSFLQVIFLLLKLWDFQILRHFNLRLFGDEVKNILAVGGVIVTIELLMSTYFLIDRYFASDMAEGVVSALNYCSLLVMLPVSIVGYAIAAVTFPYLSERANENKSRDFSSLLHSALSLAFVIGLPCGIFYLVFSRELTAAVFLRGAFDLLSLDMTSKILVTLSPYLVCLFIYTILLQACYSSGRQKLVLYIAGFSIVLKLALTGLFKILFDYPGIGLATSVTHLVTVTMLMTALVRTGRLGGLTRLLATAGKVAIASSPIFLIGYYYGNLPDFEVGMDLISKLRVVFAAILSFLCFIVIGIFIRISEVRSLLSELRKQLT